MVFPVVGGTQSTGYDISNSLRLGTNDERLEFTTSSAGNDRTFTLSFWLKKCANAGANQTFFYSQDDAENYLRFYFDTSEKMELRVYISNSLDTRLHTNRIFKDVSAWYHIVVAVDTTQGTEGNRVKLYINGVQETSFGTATYPSQNTDYPINNGSTLYEVGNEHYAHAEELDGYLADYYFVDGTAYAPTIFGESDEDSGIWKAKNAVAAFGTNGFKLEFQQTGTGTASASTIGADTSGNDNHFTSFVFAATDITTDTPTNNFATFNPLQASLPTNAIYQGLSEGNLKSWTSSADNSQDYRQWSTIAIPHTNKWFVETYWSRNSNDHTKGRIGILAYHNDITHGVVLKGDMGKIVNGTASSYESGSMAYNDIFGALYDLPNNEVTFYSNGTSLGAISWTPNANYTYYHVVFADSQSLEFYGNFGNPVQAISSGNTDPEGYGNFEHSTNNGYALCTKNLAEYG